MFIRYWMFILYTVGFSIARVSVCFRRLFQDFAFAIFGECELAFFGEAVSSSRRRLLVNVLAAFEDLADLHIMPKFDLIIHIKFQWLRLCVYYIRPSRLLHEFEFLDPFQKLNNWERLPRPIQFSEEVGQLVS